jgi:hypothetical protein
MAVRLLACSACNRHIRVSEDHCPFCRIPLPDDFGSGPAPVAPRPGLHRGTLHALGPLRAAALGGLVLSASVAGSACGGIESELAGKANDAASSDSPTSDSPADYLEASFYGSPCPMSDSPLCDPDAAVDVGSETGTDAGAETKSEASGDAAPGG